MKRQPAIQSSKSGFTLIELLVVIAIIAILAAILFPAFARARENARRASCQSNLKQMSLGILQYTQDYDEKFPVFQTQQPTGAFAWADTVQPYVKSLQLFQCPSDSVPGQADPRVDGYTDYAINLDLTSDVRAAITAGGFAFSQMRGLSMSALTQSALTVIVCDIGGVNPSGTNSAHWSSGDGASVGNATPALATFPAGAADRHLDGQNFAFCDGHVKWFKAASTTQSAKVYNFATPGSTSGSNPTFNTAP